MPLNEPTPRPAPGFVYIGRAEGMSPELPEDGLPKGLFGEMPDPPRYVRNPLYACDRCGLVVLYQGQMKHFNRCWEGLC